MAAKPKKEVHKHGCKRCRTWYEDTCATPEVDDYCVGCSGGIPMEILKWNKLPRTCCVNGGSELATKDSKRLYSLAGSTIWYQCRTCRRVFARDPRNLDPYIPDYEKS